MPQPVRQTTQSWPQAFIRWAPLAILAFSFLLFNPTVINFILDMPPVVIDFVRRSFNPGEPSSEFWTQWKNPSDVFSVLLILGGDVVGRALAQLAGSAVTPVAFSFGMSLSDLSCETC